MVTDGTEVSQLQSSSVLERELSAGATSNLEMDPESFLPTLSSGIRQHLFNGHLDNLPVVQSHVMRVYISSHFYGTHSDYIINFCAYCTMWHLKTDRSFVKLSSVLGSAKCLFFK